MMKWEGQKRENGSQLGGRVENPSPPPAFCGAEVAQIKACGKDLGASGHSICPHSMDPVSSKGPASDVGLHLGGGRRDQTRLQNNGDEDVDI